MKIQGPTSGPPTPPADESAAGVGAPAVEKTGKAFTDKLAETTRPSSSVPSRIGPSATAPAADGDIATALRTGKLNASTAVEQVVEHVLDRQLGADAPAAVREQVRAALRDALEGDPLLQEKVRRLAGGH